MAKFKYTAVATDGSEVRGTQKADSGGALRATLRERHLHLVEMHQKKGVLQLELKKKRVPRSDIMHLSRQLSAFIRSGIPILDAIDTIREEASNSRLRDVLGDIGEALRRGEPLSAAVEMHSQIFPSYYTNMLRSAELTGHLDSVLDQLAKYMERDLEARRKVKSALAYPIVIFVMSIFTVIILAAFVLPRFRKFFEGLDATLPLPTRILLGMSAFVGKWWWALTGLFILTVVLGIFYVRTPAGRALRDRTLLRIPVVRDVTQHAIIERFCRILSSMINAGVPLPEGMQLAAEGTNNVVYERSLTDVRDAMLKGEGVARPMARSQLFPGSIVQMIRVGEDTGTLDQQLETAGAFYEQELDYKIKRLTSFFEPAVIIIMGVVVGFVAIALISAMYGIFQQTGGV